MRRLVLVSVILMACGGCGSFQVAKLPPPDQPLVEEPAKEIDLTMRG